MKRIYVSLPMRGKDAKDIIKAQEELTYQAGLKLGEYVELIRPWGIHDEIDPPHPLERLGQSLDCMSMADYVVFGEGWENARGCKIERQCAEQYGIPILDLD